MMHTHECFIIYLIIFKLQLKDANCAKYSSKWIRWQSTDVTYGPTTAQNGSLSLPMCLRRCEDATDCVSAHVNKVGFLCELSNYYPPYNTLTATPRTGWTVYYRELRQVQGIRAWMSSTWSDCTASKAIDGKVNDSFLYPGCVCTHSGGLFASWIMELNLCGTVVMVTPYFRMESGFVHRNTYFRLWIYKSYNDAMNNVAGVMCREYTGPGVAKLTNFICKQQPYGGALKLQHFLANDGYLQFCEMKVFVV